MANKRLSQTFSLSWAHLPTVLLIIGYPVFWLEMYVLPGAEGRTTPLALLLFLGVCGWTFFKQRSLAGSSLRDAARTWPRWLQLTVGAAGCVTLVILGCSFYAHLLPPHLIQEYDVLNYHIALPRQHLLLRSFAHIPWATADLYFLPLDFALAPFWLVTPLPNKFPQFLFLLGLAGVAFRLVQQFKPQDRLAPILAIFAVLGSHHLGIQMGTAMLDIAMCYLLLAALDSLIRGQVGMAVVEFTFYFWSKSFIPLQVAFILIGALVLYFLLRTLGVKQVRWNWHNAFDPILQASWRRCWKRAAVIFLILSLFIGGPFVMKGIYYAGTPLFPLKPGLINVNNRLDKDSVSFQSIEERAALVRGVRNNYGFGRSLMAGLKHFWLIAVPDKGVNNRFDYPVGLMYLLFLGPFCYLTIGAFRDKIFPILPVFICIYWISWWLGTQQTRFLFVPVVLMYIAVLADRKFPTPALTVTMLIALSLVSLSVVRAHRMDFGRWGIEALREEDRKLLKMTAAYDGQGLVQLNDFDIAYAGFPVEVVDNDFVFVLKY